MAEGHLASAFKKDHCVICKLNFENEELVRVTKKGMLTIIECCEKHGKDDLYTYLNECTSTNPVLVHSDCRRNFTNKKRPGLQSPVAVDEIPSAKRLRSSTAPGRMIVCSVLNLLSWILVITERKCAQGIYYSHTLQSSRMLS